MLNFCYSFVADIGEKSTCRKIKETYVQGGKNVELAAEYDSQGNVSATQVNLDENHVHQYAYHYDSEPNARLSSIELPVDRTQTLEYDCLNRISSYSLGETFRTSVHYLQNGERTSDLVSSIWFGRNGQNDGNLRYTYDCNGNITSVRDGGVLIARYAYDSLNRLIREDNRELGTTTFRYDGGGNILEKTVYAFTLEKDLDEVEGETTNYVYRDTGWKDQLLSCGSSTCVYDDMGNPEEYFGERLEWAYGNRLKQYGTTAYTYNKSGIRTSKTLNFGQENARTTQFYLDRGNVVCQDDGVNQLHFIYGADGIVGFVHETAATDGSDNRQKTEFFYRKNAQGDVIAIYDKMGQLLASYVYDAWGKQHEPKITEIGIDISNNLFYNTNIAKINPIRYRGYYYDDESGLYYLQSRYYDPEVGRFINADDVSVLDVTEAYPNGLNLYAYCFNNPVNAVDDGGNMPNWLKWLIGGIIIAGLIVATIFTLGAAAPITGLAATLVTGAMWGAVAGATFGAIAGGLSSVQAGGNFWDGAADGFFTGAISGAITGAASAGLGQVAIFGKVLKEGKMLAKAANIAFQSVGNAAISFGATAIQGTIQGEFSWRDSLVSAGFGALGGGLGGWFGNSKNLQLQKWANGAKNVLMGFGLSGAEFGIGLAFLYGSSAALARYYFKR